MSLPKWMAQPLIIIQEGGNGMQTIISLKKFCHVVLKDMVCEGNCPFFPCREFTDEYGKLPEQLHVRINREWIPNKEEKDE